MALFKYTAVDSEGAQREGTIDAVNIDVAITALQRRGLIISAINPIEQKAAFSGRLTFFDRITHADVVMVSRQIATLFEAQVSALRAFRLLAIEARTSKLGDVLNGVADDIQSGSSISTSLERRPEAFSAFYVNMVRAGEESGKLSETFLFLADYLDRNYEVTQKTRNALIYPAFILVTFIAVMMLMMTLVIPKLSEMLAEVGQDIPIYTRVVIAVSNFMVRYIWLLGIVFVVAVVFLVRYARTEKGKEVISRSRLQAPLIGNLYKKIYLARIADNLSTMLKSGIQMLRALEITGVVVGDRVYESIITDAAVKVKGGMPLSDALRSHPEMPGIVVAMIKIGEETGSMGEILETMARFYRREVNNAVDTLVDLIEPITIVVLAVGVAFLLASVLMPIYNIASSF